MAWNPFSKDDKNDDSSSSGQEEPLQPIIPPQDNPMGGDSGGYSAYDTGPSAGQQLNTSPIRLARRIGDLFYQTGKINEFDLEEAVKLSKREGILLGRALILMGKLSETDVLQCLDQQKLVTSVDIGRLKIEQDVIELLPASLVHSVHVMPFDVLGDLLCVCAKSVLSFDTMKTVRDRTRMRVRMFDSLEGWDALKVCMEVDCPFPKPQRGR
ncbi:MAG: hypothetical protein U5N86_00945 [Planctomycetota bacterium]|nr:hypothetical protein [Planctomycetota bacterium]